MTFVRTQFIKAFGAVLENCPNFPDDEPQDIVETWSNLMTALRDFANCTHNYD